MCDYVELIPLTATIENTLKEELSEDEGELFTAMVEGTRIS